ncbi:hypothetical protein LTR70_002561 [Exophiala xenobiotica]|uniref:Uncharacterized protein n=1 Tax=Lithohypha guttulata TaxID=1690604 RepID=A0ABR0KIG0_9EURO|nr:hypothetical protein LTR24_002262 [Lithohypha guttulata]KAK5325182.1 hypothetical protein LTR70_002561 [Exophiala xenobiotica]
MLRPWHRKSIWRFMQRLARQMETKGAITVTRLRQPNFTRSRRKLDRFASVGGGRYAVVSRYLQSTSSPPNKSPITNATIELDPQNKRSLIREAFLVESISNLLYSPLIINSSTVFSYPLNDPAHIDPSLILFTRMFGGIVVGGLTSALRAGLPNARLVLRAGKPFISSWYRRGF